MRKMLTENDADAFLDWPEPEMPNLEGSLNKKCLRCKGRGGWNLAVNNSPLGAGIENTSENRHKYSHFKCMCHSCWGYGVVPNSQDCLHEFHFDRKGNLAFMEVWRCIHCGLDRDIDTSG